MNAHKIILITLIVACLALTGCASTGAATPTATQPPQPMITQAAIEPTELPAPVATSIATNVPRPTQSPDQPAQTEPPAPENTPIPTATNYSAPTVPLSPAGPWLIFRDGGESVWQHNGYLWATNPNGTGVTRLTNEKAQVFAVRPDSTIQDGLTIAYLSTNYNQSTRSYDSAIKLLSWPGGSVRTIIHKNLSEKCLSVMCQQPTWIGYYSDAMRLVWSPTGSKLAFVSAMDDINFNVFVYDTTTDQTTRIAVTELDDYKLRWSPDERYVIFETYYGVDLEGPQTDGVWSARADAGGVTQLVGRIDGQWLGPVEYLGWLSPTEVVVTFNQRIQGENVANRDIRILNVETGDYTTLVREPLLDAAYSPEHNLFLLSGGASASNPLSLFHQSGERQAVSGYTVKTAQWLGAYNTFLGQTASGRSYLMTPDGAVTAIPSPAWNVKTDHRVIVSPDNQWWAWHHSGDTHEDTLAAELWVGSAMSQPSASLMVATYPATSDLRVYWGNVIWSPDSRYLLWLTRKGLFVASPPGFEATLITEFWKTVSGQEAADLSDAVWVQ